MRLEQRYAQQQNAVKLLADFNQRAGLSLETADELRSIPRWTRRTHWKFEWKNLLSK